MGRVFDQMASRRDDLRELAGITYAAAIVVEVSPPFGHHGGTAIAGAHRWRQKYAALARVCGSALKRYLDGTVMRIQPPPKGISAPGEPLT